ncbi:MAG: hypothetical protein RBT73_03745 [Spirochaetia bacterium]|jgi:hypothetical protein|nr:hypothetical protein [Spirochaetia bacterium]
MKKRWFLLGLVLILSTSMAFAEFRFELGAQIPIGAGALTSSLNLSSDYADIVSVAGFLPIPTVSVLFQGELGSFKLGGGLRIYSLILASIAYPQIQAELGLGDVSLDFSLGGLLLGYYAIGGLGGIEGIDLLLPELSLWYSLGARKLFRLGVGAIGLIPTDFNISGLPFLFYGGFKVVL